MADKIDIRDLYQRYEYAWQDAYEWLSEAAKIIEYVAPGRGVIDRHNKPKKRSLSSRKILNNTADEAISIFVSGLHGRLTGPSRQWFQLKFDDDTDTNDVLRRWMNDSQRRIHSGFHRSNFYEQMPGFYEEWADFGNASMFMGDDDERVFQFNLMTFGEYVFTLRDNSRIDYYFRDIWHTARQLELAYGRDQLPEPMQRKLENNKDDNTFYKVVQVVYTRPHMDKPFTSVHFFYGQQGKKMDRQDKPLKVDGFYEFPFPTARYTVIGSDAFGVGLGSKILNDAMRLQEMEKAFLMATHKAVAPALNVPSHMKGKVQMMPNGVNYISSTGQKVEAIENRSFDFNGVGLASQRVEDRIKKACFNDVFLSGMRDPNASPLKATQVNRLEDEEIVRLGPAIGRLYSEALMFIVQRGFNSMLRRGLLADIDPAMLEQAGDFKINLIGPLAQMQKLIEARSVQTFFSFVGGVVSFDETAKDKINTDAAIDEYADITGVPMTVLNTEDTVLQIRTNRAQVMQQQQQQQQQVQQTAMALESQEKQSVIAKNYAQASEATQESIGGGAF